MRLGNTFWVAVSMVLAVGCVEPYSGTRLDMNLSVGAGLDSQILILPTPGKHPGEEGYFSHYELFAEVNGGVVRLATFLVQPSIRPDNPCLQYLPDDFCREGAQPCGPYINMQRFASLEGLLAVVSTPVTGPVEDASNIYGYDFVPSINFMEWPDDLFLDPSLADPAEKLSRDNLQQDAVETFCKDLPDGYYVGNPIQLTFPNNGQMYGIVDGADPRNGMQVGGITFFVKGKLYGMTSLFITKEKDPSRLLPENREREDLLPGPDSQVFLVARRDELVGYIHDREERGVTTALLVNPFGLAVTMHASIFEDMDKDPIQF